MDRMDQFLLGKPKYDFNHPAICLCVIKKQ